MKDSDQQQDQAGNQYQCTGKTISCVQPGDTVIQCSVDCSPVSCYNLVSPPGIIHNIEPLIPVWSLFSTRSLPSREFLINAKLVFLLIFELLRMGFWLWWGDVVQAFPERDDHVLTSLSSQHWTCGQLLGLYGERETSLVLPTGTISGFTLWQGRTSNPLSCPDVTGSASIIGCQSLYNIKGPFMQLVNRK